VLGVSRSALGGDCSPGISGASGAADAVLCASPGAPLKASSSRAGPGSEPSRSTSSQGEGLNESRLETRLASAIIVGMAAISWLHLSDWHQGGPDWDRSVVLEKLLDRIEHRAEIAPELGNLDFVVFSGDLAFSGAAEEFESAWSALLEPVLKLTGVGPERMFIVAGNHDLERSRFDLLPAALEKRRTLRTEIMPWLVDGEKRQRLLDPFRAYSNFVASHLQHQSAWASASTFEAGGRAVGIAGLNSALLCGREDEAGKVRDYGSLAVGEPQFRAALKAVEKADVRIFVLHHPFDWLLEFDRNDIRRPLLTAAHFVLMGHVHQPEIRAERGTEGDSIVLPAGASYDRRNAADQNYVNSFNFVNLDLDGGTGTAFIQRWSEINKRWIPDSETTPPDGRFRFELPKNLRKVAAPPATAPATEAPAIIRRQPEIRTVRGREYCLIPRGAFKMGSTPERAAELAKAVGDSFNGETPQHSVAVEAFLIGRYPVTNREYKEFADATGCAVPFRDDEWSRNMNWDRETRMYLPGRDEHPVTLVTWYDAQAYCQWLGGRLPTEAEWEKAARGEDGRDWPWGNTWQSERCNAGLDGIRNTTPVNQFVELGQSPYGARDMAGNVWEWTSSIQLGYPFDPDDGRQSDAAGFRRVHRGGAWLHPPEMVRCATRGAAHPLDFGFNVGFRVALPAAT